jgi:hypothetical protein
MLALLINYAGAGFVSPSCSMVRHSSVHRAAPAAMMAKGFGKEPEKPKAKPPSEGKKKRDAAAAKLDKLKATGNPEYMVSIRTVGSETSEWMPVGGLAVPRSNSVDTAVSMAIFNNEDELLKGAFRAFPKLKSSTDKFEYGYRLREFPDDEVRTIAHLAARSSLYAPSRPSPSPHTPRKTTWWELLQSTSHVRSPPPPLPPTPHTLTGQGRTEGRSQREHQPLYARRRRLRGARRLRRAAPPHPTAPRGLC